jgi:hypothetical protein
MTTSTVVNGEPLEKVEVVDTAEKKASQLVSGRRLSVQMKPTG